MKKLTIVLSFLVAHLLHFTPPIMAASKYDGIWELKNVQITLISSRDLMDPQKLPENPSTLDEGLIEEYVIITKYGKSGILFLLPNLTSPFNDKNSVIRIFKMEKENELHIRFNLPGFIQGVNVLEAILPEFQSQTIRITFNNAQTANYQRTYFAGMVFLTLPGGIPIKPIKPSFTVQGTLHKIAEPFD